jgi:hypothetical protein
VQLREKRGGGEGNAGRSVNCITSLCIKVEESDDQLQGSFSRGPRKKNENTHA